MPIYQYKCKTCSAEKEQLQGHNDPAPQCEKCQTKMTRRISQTSFHLKGGGWYKDGYQK